jgi:glycerate dehydrogenase
MVIHSKNIALEHIVITDGYTLNPGDLDWSAFNKLGSVTLYDRTAKDQIIGRCKDATVIITNKTAIDAQTIHECVKLKVIAVTATGYNVVSVAAAKSKGVVVCNVPAYGTDSVAQHTFAMLLELTNHVGDNNALVQKGEWASNIDWCFTKKPLIELSGKTLGIVGYGKIGQKVAEIGAAFGMKVIYINPSGRSGIGQAVSLEKLFTESDVVTLHLPLKEDNKAFVNSSLLSLMKPSAFLINTSRGQLIDESDLAHALKNRMIAGAALDVLSVEPPPQNHPLIGISTCLITPHNAWLSFEARQRIMNMTLQNVEMALAGSPQNLVI